MPAEPLLEWPQPILELAGFTSLFLAVGAIGFHGVLSGIHAAFTREESNLVASIDRRAAAFGISGALGMAALFVFRLPAMAARAHLPVDALLTTDGPAITQASFLGIALIGYALALAGRSQGWLFAAFGVIGGTLRAALFGQWSRLINPLHELAGGFWIGTLFVLAVCGVAGVLRSGLPSERRGVVVAKMVHLFSPFALSSAAVLAVFGVITAWRHLKVLSALWTTPYGFALIIKLCAVAVVLGLGAWNWKRQRPQLGSEAGARSLQGSAIAELCAAGIVLVITAVLVSLPAPKPPLH